MEVLTALDNKRTWCTANWGAQACCMPHFHVSKPALVQQPRPATLATAWPSTHVSISHKILLFGKAAQHWVKACPLVHEPHTELHAQASASTASTMMQHNVMLMCQKMIAFQTGKHTTAWLPV